MKLNQIVATAIILLAAYTAAAAAFANRSL